MSIANSLESNFKQLQSAAGVTIKYARGESNIAVVAVPSSTQFVETSGDGYMESVESRDFMFPASELNLSGAETRPERGDTITETVNGVERTSPVTNPGGGRYYRYSDPYGKILRVHTKWTS